MYGIGLKFLSKNSAGKCLKPRRPDTRPAKNALSHKHKTPEATILWYRHTLEVSKCVAGFRSMRLAHTHRMCTVLRHSCRRRMRDNLGYSRFLHIIHSHPINTHSHRLLFIYCLLFVLFLPEFVCFVLVFFFLWRCGVWRVYYDILCLVASCAYRLCS